MGGSTPWAWIFLTSLGLGLLLSSFVRRRTFFWKALGVFIILMSQAGTVLFSSLYHSVDLISEAFLLLAGGSLLFFIISLRLAFFIPLIILMFSVFLVIWGTSGIYGAEEGIYPLKITNYPPTEGGRSYLIEWADGRTAAVGDSGDYLVMENLDWNLYGLLPSRTYPVGLVGPGREEWSEGMTYISFERNIPVVKERPGLITNHTLVGPLEGGLFYSRWLIRDRDGEWKFTSLKPDE